MDDESKDLPSEIRVPFKKNAFVLRRIAPFGFWQASLEKGTISPKLSGLYLSLADAKAAIDQYIKTT